MIYITGDCHGDFSRLNNLNIAKDDYVIICGDFGGVWNKQTNKYLKELSRKCFITLFVDGNHENFNLLYKYPVIDLFGGKVHKINNKVYHLMRGEVYSINNKKFFIMGGASSHDKEDRTRDIDWWDLELPTNEELQNGLFNLEKNNYKVDYIITHCAPTSIQKRINKYYPVNKLTDYLDNIKDKVSFNKWYFGHYHQNKTYGKYVCLYEEILIIK